MVCELVTGLNLLDESDISEIAGYILTADYKDILPAKTIIISINDKMLGDKRGQISLGLFMQKINKDEKLKIGYKLYSERYQNINYIMI